jgi:hypothetical protein
MYTVFWFLLALPVCLCAAFVRHVLRRVGKVENDMARATFVPECAHEWRKLAETVAPPVNPLSLRVWGEGSHLAAVQMQRQAIASQQGSTVYLLACDKCGERVAHQIQGNPPRP